ncbi:MAG: hypothetical protein ACI9KE_006730, partial [Polyangiales bacterium]
PMALFTGLVVDLFVIAAQNRLSVGLLFSWKTRAGAKILLRPVKVRQPWHATMVQPTKIVCLCMSFEHRDRLLRSGAKPDLDHGCLNTSSVSRSNRLCATFDTVCSISNGVPVWGLRRDGSVLSFYPQGDRSQSDPANELIGGGELAFCHLGLVVVQRRGRRPR